MRDLKPAIYGRLTPWYRLIDPPEDHREEAACYRGAIERVLGKDGLTLLDLGSGAGHNALHLKERFHCTLADISEEMLALSRALNPECEHRPGDMRDLRLGRTFDAVLVHDAVMYMTSESDLRAAIRTAHEHTRPGGAAIFAPDAFRETFRESTELLSGDDRTRSLRGLLWSWDPEPNDDTTVSEFALLLREGTQVEAVHDRHLEGLFSKAVWQRLLGEAGFSSELIARPIGEGESDEIFLCRRG